MANNRTLRSGSRDGGATTAHDQCDCDVKQLFIQLESRLSTKLDNIVSRISSLEFQLNSVLSEQARQNTQINKLKEIILKQQLIFEKRETSDRLSNLILTGIPEDTIQTSSVTLATDNDKIESLCETVIDDFDYQSSILSCTRVGYKKPNKTRPLKVTFGRMQARNSLLYDQKSFRENSSSWHCKVYVNKDLPYLTRMEEKRLRNRLKDEKGNLLPSETLSLKRGKLSKNSTVIDQFDIGNQLF